MCPTKKTYSNFYAGLLLRPRSFGALAGALALLMASFAISGYAYAEGEGGGEGEAPDGEVEPIDPLDDTCIFYGPGGMGAVSSLARFYAVSSPNVMEPNVSLEDIKCQRLYWRASQKAVVFVGDAVFVGPGDFVLGGIKHSLEQGDVDFEDLEFPILLASSNMSILGYWTKAEWDAAAPMAVPGYTWYEDDADLVCVPEYESLSTFQAVNHLESIDEDFNELVQNFNFGRVGAVAGCAEPEEMMQPNGPKLPLNPSWAIGCIDGRLVSVSPATLTLVTIAELQKKCCQAPEEEGEGEGGEGEDEGEAEGEGDGEGDSEGEGGDEDAPDNEACAYVFPEGGEFWAFYAPVRSVIWEDDFWYEVALENSDGEYEFQRSTPEFTGLDEGWYLAYPANCVEGSLHQASHWDDCTGAAVQYREDGWYYERGRIHENGLHFISAAFGFSDTGSISNGMGFKANVWSSYFAMPIVPGGNTGCQGFGGTFARPPVHGGQFGMGEITAEGEGETEGEGEPTGIGVAEGVGTALLEHKASYIDSNVFNGGLAALYLNVFGVTGPGQWDSGLGWFSGIQNAPFDEKFLLDEPDYFEIGPSATPIAMFDWNTLFYWDGHGYFDLTIPRGICWVGAAVLWGISLWFRLWTFVVSTTTGVGVAIGNLGSTLGGGASQLVTEVRNYMGSEDNTPGKGAGEASNADAAGDADAAVDATANAVASVVAEGGGESPSVEAALRDMGAYDDGDFDWKANYEQGSK